MDYSKKENQIGCGYCAIEKICKIRDPKVNSAKLGCPHWVHWTDKLNINTVVSELEKPLPTDEDIITSFNVLHPIDIDNSTLEQCFLQGIRQSAFLSGARWMRDQISSQLGKEATE